MNLSKFWETLKDRDAWRAAVHGVAKSWIRLSKVTYYSVLDSEQFLYTVS